MSVVSMVWAIDLASIFWTVVVGLSTQVEKLS